jgi:hypothetical protein
MTLAAGTNATSIGRSRPGPYPMKALAVLLVGSLAANAVLVAVLLKRSPSPEASRGTNPPTAVAAPETKPAVSPPAATKAAPAETRRDTNFGALAAQLRTAGYSEDVVRNVVADIIGHHFKARRRALGLDASRQPHEFWKSAVVFGNAGTPEQLAARRALEREMRDTLVALFGHDYDVSEDDRQRRAHGLPEATAQKLHKILADYRELEEQARADVKSTAEIRAKLELLGKEKRADLERLLTPEELEEFDLRMGAGQPLLNRLGQFEVTEAEFRALYAAQKAFNAANPNVPPRERTARFEPEFQRVLGERRYAELLAGNERGARQTGAFVEMRAFVVEHNLSPSVAADVLRLESQYQPQMSVVAENPSLTAEQKAATRATLGAAARKELLRTLGPTAFEAYEKTKGRWLPPATSTPAPADPAAGSR